MKTPNVLKTVTLLLTCFFYLHGFAVSDASSMQSKIRVVCTTALIPDKYEERKKQYIHSLQKLQTMGCDFYVVESCKKGPTFLDEYCNNVCYTQSNNPSWAKGKGNYGLNEVLSLTIGLQHFNFDPDDMIIKLTGRYALEKDEFIRLVENNPQADAFLRAWNDSDAYTGLFAIRLKYLVDFLNSIDFVKMERTPIEHVFGRYITQLRANGANIFYIPHVYNYLPVCWATLRSMD